MKNRPKQGQNDCYANFSKTRTKTTVQELCNSIRYLIWRKVWAVNQMTSEGVA